MTVETKAPSKKGISRLTWAWVLIISNAISMAMMYAMQGILVAGIEHNSLPSWFWPADIGGWMVRSLVESLVVFYLFRTEARTNLHKVTIAFFEISLIVLIMLTQGPALYALTVQLPIAQTMTNDSLRLWTGGLGTYGALMLAAAGVAYKIQPDDEEVFTLTQVEAMLAAQYQEYQDEKSYLEQDLERETTKLDLWHKVIARGDWQTVQGIARIAGFISDIKPGAFAKAVNSTVSEIIDDLKQGAALREQGRYEN